jgi:hypothetical protein
MLIRRPSDIPSSEITDESLFWNLRSFIKAAGLGAAAVTLLPRRWPGFGAAEHARARRVPVQRQAESKPAA